MKAEILKKSANKRRSNNGQPLWKYQTLQAINMIYALNNLISMVALAPNNSHHVYASSYQLIICR